MLKVLVQLINVLFLLIYIFIAINYFAMQKLAQKEHYIMTVNNKYIYSELYKDYDISTDQNVNSPLIDYKESQHQHQHSTPKNTYSGKLQ